MFLILGFRLLPLLLPQFSQILLPLSLRFAQVVECHTDGQADGRMKQILHFMLTEFPGGSEPGFLASKIGQEQDPHLNLSSIEAELQADHSLQNEFIRGKTPFNGDLVLAPLQAVPPTIENCQGFLVPPSHFMQCLFEQLPPIGCFIECMVDVFKGFCEVLLHPLVLQDLL